MSTAGLSCLLAINLILLTILAICISIDSGLFELGYFDCSLDAFALTFSALMGTFYWVLQVYFLVIIRNWNCKRSNGTMQ